MKKTGWRELRKRLLALGIAAVMIGNTVDLSVLPVLAQETEDTSMEGGSTEEFANESEPQKEETSNVESNGEKQAKYLKMQILSKLPEKMQIMKKKSQMKQFWIANRQEQILRW